MPRKKEMNDYLRDFYHNNLKKKHGDGTITPSIYKKELLSFVKKMDPEFALKNIVTFLNQSAYDVVNVPDSADNYLAKDRDLYPMHYLEGLLVNNNPTKEVFEAIGSSMSKDAYVNYCQQLTSDNSINSKSAAIEYKLNKFKMIESLKPTGNRFTKFFKKLFNIGGYNDKLAAYETCKQNLKDFVGDRLTNDEFEKEIQSDSRFTLFDYKKEEQPLNLDDNEFDKEKEVNKDIKNEEPIIEIEKDIIK